MRIKVTFVALFTLLFAFTSSNLGSAAPSVASAQREVDRLRTLAATKFEAANEANIRIAELERETVLLKKRESAALEQLNASSDILVRLAVANYKAGGFGATFDLIFSADPSQYLKDASVLEMVSRGYSQEIQQFAYAQQQFKASSFRVADRTALVQKERAKLNIEVASAKSALAKAERVLGSLKREDRERLAAAEAAREGRILKASKKYATSFKGDNSRGSIALRYALSQVGDVYVYAAAGPTRWDCSGLTMRAFQKARVSLPHSSRLQVRYGKSIGYSSVKPGDLLFFGSPISHVSIYMGNGKMVHAPRPGKRVEVVPFPKRFGSKPFVGAKRL